MGGVDALIVFDEPSSRIWAFSRPTAYRLIKKYMAEASISGGMASPKGLRHGFAAEYIVSDLQHSQRSPTVPLQPFYA